MTSPSAIHQHPPQAGAAGPAISVNRLTKRYGEINAVAGVTFAVRPGEIFSYLGRNGSGKTTTVRMLTTLTRPTSGSATVAGIDIARPRDVRRRIGVTLQEAALDATMTARRHLSLVAGLWGMPRSAANGRTADLLERFGLTEAADRKIATFSGGMQRRLDIATSLISRPAVLFLDEPTTGLDPQSRRALWSEIRELRADGVTVFLTTQYLEEADELADRLAIIDRGRIIAEGTPAELKAAHGRTVITVGHRGTLEQLTMALDGVPTAPRVEADGEGRATITLADGDDSRSVLAVLDLLRRRGPELLHLEVASTSLEDAFLRLTGTSISVDAEPGASRPAVAVAT